MGYRLPLFAVAAVVLPLSAPADALTFNLVDTGGAGANSQARRGFGIAASYWSSVLTDDVTVNIGIGFRSLDEGVLGQAGSTTAGILVEQGYAALGFDRSSAVDDIAFGNLRPLTPGNVALDDADPGAGNALALTAITSGFVDPANRIGVDTTTTRLDNDGSANNSVLDVNTANLKALGFGGLDPAALDANITFSSDFRFDFNPTDGYQSNSFDFIGVAIHEIGHALGFVSGVDTYDLVGRPGSPDVGPPFPPGFTFADALEAGLLGGDGSLEDFRVMSMLDLYRYSDAGLDWSVGTEAFFSIDGGNPLFGDARFSTGAFNGDGAQASHWIDNRYVAGGGVCTTVGTAPIGIMDPTFGRCEPGRVKALDLAAFDAIGWDLNLDVLADPSYSFSTAQAFDQFVAANAIPEPMIWAQLALGFGLLGLAARRRRRAGQAVSGRSSTGASHVGMIARGSIASVRRRATI